MKFDWCELGGGVVRMYNSMLMFDEGTLSIKLSYLKSCTYTVSPPRVKTLG